MYLQVGYHLFHFTFFLSFYFHHSQRLSIHSLFYTFIPINIIFISSLHILSSVSSLQYPLFSILSSVSSLQYPLFSILSSYARYRSLASRMSNIFTYQQYITFQNSSFFLSFFHHSQRLSLHFLFYTFISGINIFYICSTFIQG